MITGFDPPNFRYGRLLMAADWAEFLAGFSSDLSSDRERQTGQGTVHIFQAVKPRIVAVSSVTCFWCIRKCTRRSLAITGRLAQVPKLDPRPCHQLLAQHFSQTLGPGQDGVLKALWRLLLPEISSVWPADRVPSQKLQTSTTSVTECSATLAVPAML